MKTIRIGIIFATASNASSTTGTRSIYLVEDSSEEQKKIWGNLIQLTENSKNNNPDWGVFQKRRCFLALICPALTHTVYGKYVKASCNSRGTNNDW